ncbi:hypothetical protein ACVJGD_008606 [Bradyrhizobium sp. USDA 10063]
MNSILRKLTMMSAFVLVIAGTSDISRSSAVGV